MDTVDLVIQSSTSFYNDLKQDKNGRYVIEIKHTA